MFEEGRGGSKNVVICYIAMSDWLDGCLRGMKASGISCQGSSSFWLLMQQVLLPK